MEFSSINLNISGSWLLLILTLIGAGILSWYVYRRTVPPVASRVKVLLVCLRTGALALVVLMLFEPIFSLTRNRKERPVVGVLIDNSASMGLTDQKVDRRAELVRVLRSDVFEQPGDFDFEFRPFSTALAPALISRTDSLSLDGDGTDLYSALSTLKEELGERYFAATVVLTDGGDNLGQNPARLAPELGVPIFPIAIGDQSEQTDVLISDYVSNEVTYAGTQIPIDVYLKSAGFKDKKVPVSVTLDGKVLDSQTVTLSGNSFDQKVRLEVTPEDAGMFKYELSVPHLEGELTSLNNRKSFYVKVLKSKQKVLLVAGGPSPDYRFLKAALDKDENLSVTPAIEKQNGTFYYPFPEATELNEFDCIILLDFPRRSSDRSTLEKLKEVLARGKSLLYIGGKQVDFQKLLILNDFLPFEQVPGTTPEKPVYLQLMPQGQNHPLMRLSENELDNREKWRELPPVFTNVAATNLKSGSQTLATTDVSRSASFRARPSLISALRTGNRKTAAILAYGLWRWDFLLWGTGRSNASYTSFLKNTIRWLTSNEDSKLVRIAASKEIYRSGEAVKFSGQVYYEDYEPVDGADVVVQITGSGAPQELTLSGIGQGRYEGVLQVLTGGDYEFRGTAHQEGRVLGRDAGKFSVEQFNLEFQNTRMNEELLQKLARESGGTYFDTSNFEQLRDKLQFENQYVVLKSEWEIWNRWVTLAVCIFLLSAEWFIRKRKGML